MKQINLRDYYPHYKEDKIVEVPDEVAALLEDLDRKEESYLRYLRRYGAFFTFDLGDIKEKDMPFQKSPSGRRSCAPPPGTYTLEASFSCSLSMASAIHRNWRPVLGS